MHDKVYTCFNCGCDFCLLERPRHFKKFCSKKCQKLFLKNNPNLPKKVHKFQTKEQFTSAALQVILSKDRYTLMDEICAELHVCSTEFKRLGINIYELNELAGFTKPVSVAELIVCKFLEKHNIMYETQATFEEFRSTKGMVLRYDIYVPGAKLFIEVDGAHHKKGHSWYTEHRAECDKAKDVYAAKIGRHLLRIAVTKAQKLTDEYLLQVLGAYINILGNQQPEALGMGSNGSETHRSTRPVGAGAHDSAQHGAAWPST